MSFGWTAARDGNQVRFLLAVQLALPARPWRSLMAASSPSSTNRFRTLATVAALTKSTPAISRSRSPSSALSSASARLTVRADGLPRRETSLRRERSDSASLTLYLMAAVSGYSPTERSYPSMAAFSYLQIYLDGTRALGCQFRHGCVTESIVAADGNENAIGPLIYHIAEAEMGWLWGNIQGSFSNAVRHPGGLSLRAGRSGNGEAHQHSGHTIGGATRSP